jgi:hypothetical protein
MQTLAQIFWQKKQLGLLCWLVVAATILPSSAQAIDVSAPFSTSNSSPLVLIYGLPDLGRAFLLEQGQGQVEVALSVTNNFLHQANATEELRLDGETYRARLRWEYALLDNLELGVDIPYLFHAGGSFDGVIDGFHKTFGFSRGERASAPENQLNYRYRSGSQTLLDINRADGGLGDLRLTTAWQLFRQSGAALSLRGSLKLPTGDSDRLTGSGGTDIAVWLSGARIFATDVGPVSLYGAFGGVWLGEPDVMPELHRQAVVFGGFGAGWSPWQWLKLQLQVDLHSAFYRESKLRSLGDESMMLTMGGVLALSQNQELELALVEDVAIETAPDVAIHLAWRYRY